MRQGTKQMTNRNSSAAETFLDPSETPIKGPGARQRKTATAAARSDSRSHGVRASSAGAASQNTAVNKPSNKTPITRHFAPNVVTNKQNMSSNSESDQTDTDSNNVTGPQRPVQQMAGFQQMKNFDVKCFSTKTDNNGRKVMQSSRNIPPVVKSSDTDNDFPTTDFNNEEEQVKHNNLNDLNRTDGKSAVAASTPVFPLASKSSSQSGQTSAPRVVSVTPPPGLGQNNMSAVSASVPVLRKKVYTDSTGTSNTKDKTPAETSSNTQKQNEVGRQAQTGPSSKNDQRKANTNNSYSSNNQASSSNKSRDIEKPKEEAVRPRLRLPTSLSDTFEDDMLFETPSMDQRNWTPRTPSENSGTQPRIPQDPSLQPEIPAVLPAKSTELASFSQSPRWHLNKHQNTPQPQPIQGFRPEPVRVNPKQAWSGDKPGDKEGISTKGTENRTTSAGGDTRGKTNAQGLLKHMSNYFPTASSNISNGNSTKQSTQGNSQHAQSKLTKDSKEPISANWFETPADFDTHLAVSQQKKLKAGNTSDNDSISTYSDKSSIKSDRAYKGGNQGVDSDSLPVQRNADKSGSAHSDSGIVSVASDSALDTRTNGHRLSKFEKDKNNYQSSVSSTPGYFGDNLGQNAFQVSRSRVVHSPVHMRHANSSPVIRDYVSSSPVPASDRGANSHDGEGNSDADVAGATGAVTSEKLQSGSCFSPIHPQPLTSISKLKTTVAVSKDIIHPTPVTVAAGNGDRRQPQHRSNSSTSDTVDLKYVEQYLLLL